MSAEMSTKERIIRIEINGSELTSNQVRLIRSLNSMLTHVMLSNNEEDYFEGSAEFMRMCAAIIKQSNFKAADKIPYAQQALEYSIDVLQEYVTASKVVTYDN